MSNLLLCSLKHAIICFICLENMNLFGFERCKRTLVYILGATDKNGFYKSKDLNIIIHPLFYSDGMLQFVYNRCIRRISC